MKAATLTGARTFALRDTDDPPLGEQDVRVQTVLCGVCASELHTWMSGVAPAELGHEVTGYVLEVGRCVAGYRVGDAVGALVRGGFAERIVAPADRLRKIPAGLDPATTLAEPVSCVVDAADRITLQLGDDVAIVGVGFMGLLLLQAMRQLGAGTITVIDPRRHVLQRALSFGADAAFIPDEVPEELYVPIRPAMDRSRGVDVAIEASGTREGLATASKLVREHGQLVIFGFHDGDGGMRQVDMHLWNHKALAVLNAHERRGTVKVNCFERGLALLAAGRIQTASLISHRFPIEKVNEAFSALAGKPASFIKAVVEMDAGGGRR